MSQDDTTDEKPMHEYPPAECGECGRPTNRKYVEKHKLRNLVDKIRDKHEHLQGSDDSFHAGAIGMQESILTQLEALINDTDD